MRSRPGSGALIGLLSVVACSPPPRSGAERARATTAIEGGSASDRAVDGTSGPVTTHAARPEATAGGVDPIDGGDGIDAAFLRRHTAALSDDSMEGRRPGTPGGARAVAYIVAQMQALGLTPAGEDGGWTQSVPMRAVRLDPARSTVGLRSGSDREPESLILGEQIMAVAMGPTGTTRVDAPLVFVGYGVTAPRFDWDDYGELDLRGKIAVVLVGDPPVDDGRFDGLALTEYGRWTYKLRRAEDAGASGCLLVHETKAASYDWTVVRSSWSGERYALREPEGPPEGLPMYGWIHQQLAERLAGLDGRTLADWHAMAIDPKFSPVDLPARLSATLTTTVIALSVAVPLGLGVAILLSEYSGRRVRAFAKPVLEVLAGIPTVVYGFFALEFITPMLRGVVGIDGLFSTLSAGIVMGFMILPTIASLSEVPIAPSLGRRGPAPRRRYRPLRSGIRPRG